MAADDIKNVSAPAELKTVKKKKAKAAASLERNTPPVLTATTKAGSTSPNETAHDEAGESPHLRELRKRLRNVNKKLSNATKTNPLIAENPGKSLDELVSLKIINADQKAQRLGIPKLEEKSQQIVKQIVMLEEVEKEFKIKLAEQDKNLTEQFEKEKAALIANLEKKAETEHAKSLHDSLLLLSQFLRLAAARRAEDAETIEDEGQALEGVLLQVYSGDDNAVATMLKLVHGSDEPTMSTSSETLQTTFAQVKQLAIAHAQPLLSSEEPGYVELEETEAVEAKESPQTDPTLAHAGLTEIVEGSSVPLTNGHVHEPSPTNGDVPPNAVVADDAANQAGENQWDVGNDGNDMSMSQEWVDVKLPRDSCETDTGLDTGLDSFSAAPGTIQSWADEQPEPAGEAIRPTIANDGFVPVQQRNRVNRDGNGNRGRGGFRGRGGSFRGDGRGRGRGRGGNFNRGAPRRAAEES